MAHLNGQVGWVSLHLHSFLLLHPCWWPLPFWTCFDTVPFPCMEVGSSPASQEGLGQLRGAAQLTTSQLSFAHLQSLVHHCMHHRTDCTGGQWQRQHKWQEDWQHCHHHCSLWTCHCVKNWTQLDHCFSVNNDTTTPAHFLWGIWAIHVARKSLIVGCFDRKGLHQLQNWSQT